MSAGWPEGPDDGPGPGARDGRLPERRWHLAGRTLLVAAVLGGGVALVVTSSLEGEVLLATMFAILTTALVLGMVGRFGIPRCQRRSRLPVALQGVLLGASTVAVLIALAEVRAWVVLAAAFWMPVLFPEAVPSAVYRRLVSGSAEDEDHVPSGPRWQDRPLAKRG